MSELAMAKGGPPACIVNPEVEIRLAAEDATADDFRTLKIATEAAMGYSPQVVDQLWGFWHERSRRGGVEPLLGDLEGTPPRAIHGWGGGALAWVDHVPALPAFRLPGISRAEMFLGGP